MITREQILMAVPNASEIAIKKAMNAGVRNFRYGEDSALEAAVKSASAIMAGGGIRGLPSADSPKKPFYEKHGISHLLGARFVRGKKAGMWGQIPGGGGHVVYGISNLEKSKVDSAEAEFLASI